MRESYRVEMPITRGDRSYLVLVAGSPLPYRRGGRETAPEGGYAEDVRVVSVEPLDGAPLVPLTLTPEAEDRASEQLCQAAGDAAEPDPDRGWED